MRLCRRACTYVDRVFTNGGLGRLLFCRLKEESMRGIGPVKRFFLKLTGHFLFDCPNCFR